MFVGAYGSEALSGWSTNMDEISGFEMIGCEATMFANKLSFFFDLKGRILYIKKTV